jgi:hypothetical protein
VTTTLRKMRMVDLPDGIRVDRDFLLTRDGVEMRATIVRFDLQSRYAYVSTQETGRSYDEEE